MLLITICSCNCECVASNSRLKVSEWYTLWKQINFWVSDHKSYLVVWSLKKLWLISNIVGLTRECKYKRMVSGERNAGTTWWLNADDAEMATEVVMQRTATDPWEAEVLSFVRNKHEVSSRDIFKHLNIDLPQRSQVFEKRVLGIITRAGWTKDGKFWSGDNRGTARYVPPGALGVWNTNWAGAVLVQKTGLF